jgi:FtsZ-interacting cell division protein ZipA
LSLAMPELRWTLLILGALFIGGLALWEWRRQRYARGPDAMPAPHAGGGVREGERISPTFGASPDVSFDPPAALSPTRGVFREPTLTFPEVSVEIPADSRDRFADPPVVELDDESLDRLKVEAGEAVDEFSEPVADEDEDEVEAPPADEPMIPRLSPAVAMAPTLTPAGAGAAGPQASRDAYRPGEARDSRRWGEWRDPGEPGTPLDAHDEPTTRFDASEPESARAPGHEPVHAAAAAPLNAESLDSFEPESAEPIVEWPDEGTRKIVALRLVSGIGERFAGRAVRLALAAEGFVLGKFEIFHKPGPDARAVLSAASLTKPGMFSLDTMDAQRFGGISLFAVLPGPLSPQATFDELLTTARSLNDRLRGALQDERGEPLTPMRSANMRESLAAAASAAAPVLGAAVAPPVVGDSGSTSPA